MNPCKILCLGMSPNVIFQFGMDPDVILEVNPMEWRLISRRFFDELRQGLRFWNGPTGGIIWISDWTLAWSYSLKWARVWPYFCWMDSSVISRFGTNPNAILCFELSPCIVYTSLAGGMLICFGASITEEQSLSALAGFGALSMARARNLVLAGGLLAFAGAGLAFPFVLA